MSDRALDEPSPPPWFLLAGSMGYRHIKDRNEKSILRVYNCPEYTNDPDATEDQKKLQANLEYMVNCVNKCAGFTDKDELIDILLGRK